MYAGGSFCSGLLPAVAQESSTPGRGAGPKRSLRAAQVLSSLQPSLLRAHLVKSVTSPSLRSACSGQQPRDQQRPCCSFPSPWDGGIVGFDVQGQGWGRVVCAHESLARLQLPLKCSSDQDEREGSPSPNHLALIAGRNASLRPPPPGAVGRGHSMLFVNPTALDWADAKGESLGTKGGFSWAARNRQTLAEMLGVRAPLLSAWSCGALQTFPRTPVPPGRLCQLFPSRVSWALWSLLAPGVTLFRASAHRGRDEERGNAGQAQHLLATSPMAGAASRAGLPVCYPCSSWDTCPWNGSSA